MNKTPATPKHLPSCNRMLDKIDARQGYMPDRALEEAASLPRNKMNKIRTGRQYMRADELWRVARALRVPVEWLLNDDLTTVDLDARIGGSDIPAAVRLDGDGANAGTDSGHKPKIRKPKKSPSR